MGLSQVVVFFIVDKLDEATIKMSWLKRFLIGKPLDNEALKHEKYSVFWGLPILSSDALPP